MNLFDENHKYTPEAGTLDLKACEILKVLFQEYAEKGYSPREISHVIIHAVFMAELETVLGWNDKN